MSGETGHQSASSLDGEPISNTSEWSVRREGGGTRERERKGWDNRGEGRKRVAATQQQQ